MFEGLGEEGLCLKEQEIVGLLEDQRLNNMLTKVTAGQRILDARQRRESFENNATMLLSVSDKALPLSIRVSKRDRGLPFPEDGPTLLGT